MPVLLTPRCSALILVMIRIVHPASRPFDVKHSTFLVRAETLHRRLSISRLRILPAVALIVACAWVGPANASSVTSSLDDEAHAKACKCGTKCRGASCCCGSPKTRPKAPARPLADPGSNPCQFSQAPCSDPIAPVAAPVGSVGKVATLGSPGGFTLGDEGQPLVVPAFVFSTDRRQTRLDRPPRFVAFA